jgi:acetyltransferase-like isoleucine patch superfamily enzyme
VAALRHWYWLLRAVPRSALFNLRYFPPRTAVRLPVLVSHRTVLRALGGTVELGGRPRTGVVRVGFGGVGIFDQRFSRTVWEAGPSARVRFEGRAFLGHGSRLSALGDLTFGDGFLATAEARIICHHRVGFGRDVLMAWEATVVDTDFHRIYKPDGTWNVDAPVSVGDDVWLASGSWVHGGATVGSGSVIAAGAHVLRGETPPRALLAGIPARVVREDVSWDRSSPAVPRP